MGENKTMRANYATVKIPLELADKLDKIVSDMGYRSRAEIVNDAIRRFIDERKRLEGLVATEETTVESRQQRQEMGLSPRPRPPKQEALLQH